MALVGGSSFSSDLRRFLLRQQEEGTWVDVTLKTSDGHSVSATKALLAARSSVFAAMFDPENQFREASSSVVEIVNFSGQIMNLVVEYCYTDCLESFVIEEKSDVEEDEKKEVNGDEKEEGSAKDRSQDEDVLLLRHPTEKSMRCLVRLYGAAHYFDLPGLAALVEGNVASMLRQHCSLACCVIDEIQNSVGIDTYLRTSPHANNTGGMLMVARALIQTWPRNCLDPQRLVVLDDKSNFEWQFCEDGPFGGLAWQNFDDGASERLEEAYKKRAASGNREWSEFDMRSANLPYRVVFSQCSMTARRQSTGFTGRNDELRLRRVKMEEDLAVEAPPPPKEGEVNFWGRGFLSFTSEGAAQYIIQDKERTADDFFLCSLILKWAEEADPHEEEETEGGEEEEGGSSRTEEKRHVAKRLIRGLDLSKVNPSELMGIVLPSGLADKDQLLEAYQAQALLAQTEGVTSFARLPCRDFRGPPAFLLSHKGNAMSGIHTSYMGTYQIVGFKDGAPLYRKQRVAGEHGRGGSPHRGDFQLAATRQGKSDGRWDWRWKLCQIKLEEDGSVVEVGCLEQVQFVLSTCPKSLPQFARFLLTPHEL